MRAEANKLNGLHAGTKSFMATKHHAKSLLPLGAASALPLYMLVSRLSLSQPGKRLFCSELGLFVAI
jgi:hypothetical protein